MALKKHSVADIQSLEDDLLQIAGELREIRVSMLRDQMTELDLETAKAAFYIEYLKSWAPTMTARFRQQKGKRDAQNLKQQLKNGQTK